MSSIASILLRSVKNSTFPRHLSSLASQNQASQKFDYILPNSLLSKDQQEHYEQNGFIVVRNLIPEDEIKAYLGRFREYATGRRKPESPELTLQKEISMVDKPLDENSLYKILELYSDDVLFGYCKNPRILKYAECFVGPNIMAVTSMIINKPPDSGNKSSRHPLHQDVHYFPFRPVNRIVCSWTAMQKVSRENGCLVVIPGSHKMEHLDHEYPDWEGGVNKFYYGVDIPEELSNKRQHLEMNIGDTVFFHPVLIHGSGVNRTKGYRKAICCHYAPVDAEFIDFKGTKQQKMADEVVATLKKNKLKNIDLDYTYLWKFRARNVHGEGGWEI